MDLLRGLGDAPAKGVSEFRDSDVFLGTGLEAPVREQEVDYNAFVAGAGWRGRISLTPEFPGAHSGARAQEDARHRLQARP